MNFSKDNPFVIKEGIEKIPGFKRLYSQGDSFWPGTNRETIYSSLSRQKFKIIFFVILACFGIILTRAFWLQVVQGDKYNLIAEGNRIRLQTIPAERGIIYDRYGNALVSNQPNFSLYFTPADLADTSLDKQELALKLSQIINKSSQELNNIFIKSYDHPVEPVLISGNLSQSQAVSLSVIDDDLPAVKLIGEPRRDYLDGYSLAHILGYIGKISPQELDSRADYELSDYLGKDGIELYYEDILKGTNGRQEIEVDATGKIKKILNEIQPRMGKSIVLSIDLDLQKKLSSELESAIKKSNSPGGVGIALDPQNGEILALVSLPSFDNNYFSAGIQSDAYANYLTDPGHPLFNRAIAGTYPPGSIFKPLVALAALEEGIIDESKTFLSTGGIQINQWFFPDWKYGGHGRVNIIRAIADSVNTFFYYIGGGYNEFVGLGVEKIVDYAKKFNLSHQLGVDLPGEAQGFLPNPAWKKAAKGESWYIGDTYHLAIGQGDILVTPLQVAAYTAAIANGGTLYRTHLLKEIKSTPDSNVYPFAQSDFVINKNFISSSSIDIVRRALRTTVTDGSARSLAGLPVAVAGKTGTAQVGGNQPSHAWFTGFAPYDSPSIVLTILIENGGEGSSVAVPVFKNVVDWYFSEN